MSVELISISISVFVAVSIVLYTILVGISPMPSSARSRDVILEILNNCSGTSIVELGSGWGNLLIPIARHYPDKKITAYELSPFPFLVSIILKFMLRLNNLHIYRRDFLGADLSGADILVCYLHPNGMKRLSSKLKSEKLSPNVISNTFAFDHIKPQQTARVKDLYNSLVYLYHLDF